LNEVFWLKNPVSASRTETKSCAKLIKVYSLIIEAILPMLPELETQLLALTPTEKAEVIRLLTQSLSNSWPGITKTPGVCGGDACIAKTRIPVWGLVESRGLGITESELLNDYPHISAADLVNVWSYANAHLDEIEAAIKKNEEA